MPCAPPRLCPRFFIALTIGPASEILIYLEELNLSSVPISLWFRNGRICGRCLFRDSVEFLRRRHSEPRFRASAAISAPPNSVRNLRFSALNTTDSGKLMSHPGDNRGWQISKPLHAEVTLGTLHTRVCQRRRTGSGLSGPEHRSNGVVQYRVIRITGPRPTKIPSRLPGPGVIQTVTFSPRY